MFRCRGWRVPSVHVTWSVPNTTRGHPATRTFFMRFWCSRSGGHRHVKPPCAPLSHETAFALSVVGRGSSRTSKHTSESPKGLGVSGPLLDGRLRRLYGLTQRVEDSLLLRHVRGQPRRPKRCHGRRGLLDGDVSRTTSPAGHGRTSVCGLSCAGVLSGVG